MDDMRSILDSKLDTTQGLLVRAQESLSAASAQSADWPVQRQRVRESVLPLLRSWIPRVRAQWPPDNLKRILAGVLAARMRAVYVRLSGRTLWRDPHVIAARLVHQALRVACVLVWLYRGFVRILPYIVVVALIIGLLYVGYLVVANFDTILNWVRPLLPIR